jgi:hypothetical protein
MNVEEYNILSTVSDPTYRDNYDAISAFKIIPKIVSEEKMTITCMVVVNLLNRSEMRQEAKKAEDQLDKACNETLKRIKKDFKASAGRTLKTKQAGCDTSVELISMSSYSPKGTALVRHVYSFEVS